MSRQLVQRCTTMMPWRQSIFSPQVRTATRPGQQRQLTAAADRTIATSPAASAPIDYHARFSQQRGIHSYRPLNTTPVNSSMSLPSVRCFSTDDKEDKKDEGKKEKTEEKKEATKESTEKKEATKESKEKESVAAADEDAAETSKDGAAADADPAAAAPAAKAEEEDDCPPWMNPLHHADKSPSKEFREDLEPGEELKVLPAAPLADPNNPDKVLASQEVYDLADEIVNLSMLEMKELITKIGDHFGFEEPPFRGSDGSGGGDDGGGEDEDAPAAEVKTQFDVKLESYDAKSKIKVIKEVRAVAGLGLKEAKELVEGAPKVVMKDVSKDTAEELKEKLEAVGAVIEIV